MSPAGRDQACSCRKYRAGSHSVSPAGKPKPAPEKNAGLGHIPPVLKRDLEPAPSSDPNWDQFHQPCREMLSQLLQEARAETHPTSHEDKPSACSCRRPKDIAHSTSPAVRHQACSCKGPGNGTSSTSPGERPLACSFRRTRDVSYSRIPPGRPRACPIRRPRSGSHPTSPAGRV